MPAALRSTLALACGLAVIEACVQCVPGSDAHLRLKWPNDCLLHGRKLAGILVEGAGDRAVIGIGLNRSVRFEDPMLQRTAASLHEVSEVSVISLIDALRTNGMAAAGIIARDGLQPLLVELRRRDAMQGASVSVQESMSGPTWHGQAAGIAEDGRLLVINGSGRICNVAAGSVSWLPSVVE